MSDRTASSQRLPTFALTLAWLAWLGGCGVIEIVLHDPLAGDDDTTDSAGDDDSTADDDTSGDDDSTADDDDSTGDDDTTGVADADGDGWDADQDCDDSDPALNLDDSDGDGYTTCSGDCDDTDPQISPGATDLCDGEDEDCDGVVDGDCLSCDWEVPVERPTIQGAIDSVVWDEVVCVAPGTYVENLDTLGKVVTVVGTAGPTQTTVDGGAAGPVLAVQSGETSGTTVQGFTLTNGAHDMGGGIAVIGSAPTLRNLRVTGNVASESGGGIYLHTAFPAVERLIIQGNQALETGGAVYEYASGAQMVQVDFLENQAPIRGGALHASDSASFYTGTVFARNSTSGHGGPIAAPTGAPPLRGHAWIADNDAGGDGGGLHAIGALPGLTSVLITDNRTLGGGDGGGIFLGSSSNPTLDHVTVVGNSASGNGGGIAMVDSHGSFSQVSVTHNDAGVDGGGVYGIGSTPVLSYGNVWGNQPTDFAGIVDPTGTGGNLSADPGHPEISLAESLNWDLHLDPGSDLVDAGGPSDTDPDGGTGDIGALGGAEAEGFDLDRDGYPVWWQPGAYDPATYPADGLDCDDTDPGRFPGQGC